LLPVTILTVALNWFFHMVTDLIQPLTNLLIQSNSVSSVVPETVSEFILGDVEELLGDILVMFLIALCCFVVGSLVSTSVGRWMHGHFDKYLVHIAPGYKLIKEIVSQFFGDQANSPFSNGETARVKIFGVNSETTVTAIVTSRHEDGCFTVFVPTGPNPTSGNMYHLPPEQVKLYPNVKVEDVMRTIIACGAGSGELFQSKTSLMDDDK